MANDPFISEGKSPTKRNTGQAGVLSHVMSLCIQYDNFSFEQFNGVIECSFQQFGRNIQRINRTSATHASHDAINNK
jgi:hypothetical protein